MPKEVKCPEPYRSFKDGLSCGTPMHKAGPGVSGRKEYQRYRCPKCFRTWLNTKEKYIRNK